MHNPLPSTSLYVPLFARASSAKVAAEAVLIREMSAALVVKLEDVMLCGRRPEGIRRGRRRRRAPRPSSLRWLAARHVCPACGEQHVGECSKHWRHRGPRQRAGSGYIYTYTRALYYWLVLDSKFIYELLIFMTKILACIGHGLMDQFVTNTPVLRKDNLRSSDSICSCIGFPNFDHFESLTREPKQKVVLN